MVSSVAKNVIENELHDRVIFFDELARMVANNDAETQMLCEAFDLTLDDVIGVTENGSVVITENQNVYVKPITDRTIRSKTQNMLNDCNERIARFIMHSDPNGYILNDVKVSLYKLMDEFNKYTPKGLIRFKGLRDPSPYCFYHLTSGVTCKCS